MRFSEQLEGIWKKGMLAAFLILALSVSAFPQSTTTGAVSGTVTDPSDRSVPNASVTATNIRTNAQATATSDDNGRFFLGNLLPGVYTVEVSAQGFSSHKRESVTVEIGRVTSMDTKLGLAGVTETVTATAEAPVITTDRQDISTNINSTSIQNLPINGRRWSNLVVSTPGATPDGGFGLISFRGISGLLNNNTVDGGDNNQAFFAEEKGRTRISYSTSQAFIQEYQVNTSNFSAEYGRSAGGVVNAVTKSGANQFHGDAFWFYRSSDFGAFNPFATIVLPPPAASTPVPVKPPDKRHQFGGTISGPIVRDRLYFFFGADQQLRNFPGVANASSPAAFFTPLSVAELATLSGRGVNAVQANAGLAFLQTLTGVVQRSGDQLILFPKIDWRIDGNNLFTIQYNRMRWSSPAGVQTAGVVFRGRESWGSDFVKTDTMVTKWVSTITPTLVNEARFAYGRDFEFQTSQPSIPGEPVSAQGVSPQITISGSSGIVFGKPNFLDRRAFPDERNYQFSDTLSWSRGRHFFKIGVDINRVHDLQDNLFQESGAYSYGNRVNYISDYAAFANGFANPVCGTAIAPAPCYDNFNQGFGPTAFEFTTVDYGIFFQDTWRATSRLTLNLGLRWDYQQMPQPQITNPLLPLSSQIPSDTSNFGPRLGAAWDLTGTGKMVLRGGYGIYYGRIINSTILNGLILTGTNQGQLQFQFLPSNPAAPRYPNVVTTPPVGTGGGDVIFFPSNTQSPMIHQFDVAFEYQLARNTAVSVFYMGSLGRHLPRFVDTNLNPPTSTVTYTVVGGPDDGASYTFPAFTNPRPNTNFGRITAVDYGVNATYHGLVVQFNRRMTAGLQVQASYTYSQATDSGQGSVTFTNANNVLNPFDLGLENGRSNFDIPHRFAASLIWQPQFFRSSGRGLRYLLDDWTIAPIVTVSSGSPYTGGVTGNIPNPTCTGGAICPTPISTPSTNLLGAGGSGRLPNFERNIFRQPYVANVDIRIGKKFPIRESMAFEIFGEAFNLFNRVNITQVGTRIYSTAARPGTATVAAARLLNFDPQFTVPTASSNFFFAQRQIQIGAKFNW